MPNNAPIIFLLGTSTAGKTTICDQILNQEKIIKNLGLEVWGTDKQFDDNTVRCRDLLKDDQRFLNIEPKFPHVRNIIAGIYFSEVKDNKTGKLLNLIGEEFDKKLGNFLAETEGRFDEESLKILKTLAEENPNNFKEKAKSIFEESIFDKAIENSKNGKPTILDMVPSQKDEVEEFKNYLAKKNHNCPTFVAVAHVPVKELTKRMGKRNKQAENENSGNERDGFFPFTQYAEIFGSNATNPSQNLGTLSQVEVYQAIGKFGDKEIENEFGDKVSDKVRIKFRDMKGVADENPEIEHKSKMRGTFDILRAGKEFLTNELGFEDGQNSISLGVKVKADAVYEHSQGSTVQIAEKIYDWTKEKMAENQVQANEKAGNFAAKYPSRKGEEKSFSEIARDNESASKEGGEKGGRC